MSVVRQKTLPFFQETCFDFSRRNGRQARKSPLVQSGQEGWIDYRVGFGTSRKPNTPFVIVFRMDSKLVFELFRLATMTLLVGT